MKNAVRAALAATLLLLAGPALAQNVPANSIQGRLGIPAGGGPVQSIPLSVLAQQIFTNVPSPLVANFDIVGSITTRRTTATDVGGTLTLGHGAYPWQVVTNQVTGGDFSIINPSGQTVLYMPQTGVNVNVGQGVGLSKLYVFGSQFVASQGPILILQGGSQQIAQLGADCAILASPCNTDFYIVGPNNSRSANFYQWSTVSVNTTLTASPTRYVGGALAVVTDTANAVAGGNGITSQVNLTTSGNFPTAVTALVNATGSAAAAWGVFAECDLHAAIECAAVEATVGNRAGAPNLPPVSTVSNPTQPFTSALKATCGGQITPVSVATFGCSVGLWIHYYNGNGGWPFLYGIYMTEGTAATVGIQVNATATLSPTTSALFKNSGTGQALVLQQMDGGIPGTHIMEVRNSTNSVSFAINNNGTLDTPTIQGGSANSLTGLSLLNSGFNQSFAVSGTLTANRSLGINLNNTSPTLSMNGNVTFGGAFTMSGAFGFTGTLTNTTSVTFPTSGTLVSSASNLSVFAATTSAQLAGVLSDETGTGVAVFNSSPALTSPTITGGSVTALTNLSLVNSGFTHAIASGGTLTANRTLTITLGDASRTLTQTSDTSIGAGQYLATATNDNAVAGNIGEFVTASLASGSAVSLVTGTAKTVTSLSLTAGDWDIHGSISYLVGGATTFTEQDCDLSTVNNTYDATNGRFITQAFPSGSAIPNNNTVAVNGSRFSLSGTTTVFLIAFATFGTSTSSAYGSITARRVR